MSYASEVLADSPAAYWRLGEASGDFADSSGNGLTAFPTGVTHGVASLLASDPADKSASVINTNSFTTNGARTTGNITGNRTAMSLEAWINTTQTGNQAILMCDNSSTLRLFQYRVSSGKLQMILFDSGGAARTITSTVSVNDGLAHHVVGTYDGAKMHLYIDGVEDGTGTAIVMTIKNTSVICGLFESIGATCNTLGGTGDEFAIYYSALSAARVLAHYNAGIAPATSIKTVMGVSYPTNVKTIEGLARASVKTVDGLA